MQKPSWLFWIVSIIALLYGVFGGFDFYMTSTGNEKYLKDFPPEMIAWIQDFPLWRTILWGATVAAGVIGPLLMLMRNGLAPTVMWAGVVGMILGFVGHDILMANGVKYYGQMGLIASVVLVVLYVLFAWYASRAKAQGYLK